jgi:hypothetical protein
MRLSSKTSSSIPDNHTVKWLFSTSAYTSLSKILQQDYAPHSGFPIKVLLRIHSTLCMMKSTKLLIKHLAIIQRLTSSLHSPLNRIYLAIKVFNYLYSSLKKVSLKEALSSEAKSLLNYILQYYINARTLTQTHLIHGGGPVWYKDVIPSKLYTSTSTKLTSLALQSSLLTSSTWLLTTPMNIKTVQHCQSVPIDGNPNQNLTPPRRTRPLTSPRNSSRLSWILSPPH